MTTNKQGRKLGALLTLAVLATLSALIVAGVPQGANIVSSGQESQPSSPPDNRSDDGGTINVLVLNTVQQNPGWKAYVGNVTGRLTLDDADGYTIYDWALAANSIQGEVYVSRNSSITWSNISCASSSVISSEESYLGKNPADPDSINNTFNYTVHKAMQVGVNSISQDSCRSTATYVNDSRQSMSNTSLFQEILLQDQNNVLIYATFIDQDSPSYKNLTNHTYDFQLIVGEDETASTPTTYYFYLEIS